MRPTLLFALLASLSACASSPTSDGGAPADVLAATDAVDAAVATDRTATDAVDAAVATDRTATDAVDVFAADLPTVTDAVDVSASDSAVATDAVDAGGLGAGATCTATDRCAPGLLCCYPCGIPGCANRCMPPMAGTDRCPLFP